MNKYNLNFSLCLNKDIDEKVKECIAFCCDFLLEHYPQENIEAIILTGSFSRGGGTVVLRNGSLKFFSDMDFWVVVKNTKLKSARNDLKELSKEASSQIKSVNGGIDVSFGATTRKILRRLKPIIFTIEAQNSGKVVWGNTDILKVIPPLDKRLIPKTDAINLLFNRSTEQLAAYGNSSEAVAYQITKAYLDIATSILIFEGIYVQGYFERVRKLKEISDKLDLNLSCLIKEMEKWTKFKVTPVTGMENILEEWFKLRTYMKTVWVLEVKRYLGTDIEDTATLAKLYLKKDNLIDKLRGFLKAFKNPYLSKNKALIARLLRISTIADVRNLVRIAGMLTYLNLGNGMNKKKEEINFISSLLPVCFKKKRILTWNDLKEEVFKNWSVLAKEG